MTADRTLTIRLYDRLIHIDETRDDGEIPPELASRVPGNAVRIIGASALQNIGDRIVDAKTVLPWLFASLGAPTALVGLLVPIRESGSMLPQAALLPRVRRQAVRKWLWVAGAAGQAGATMAMAVVAATASGTAAAVAILLALTLFALSRSLSSIASKDVLGRTIPKGQRGQINGISALVSGGVAITIGLGIRLLGGDDIDPMTLAALLGAAAVLWVVALVLYATIDEPVGEVDQELEPGWLTHAWNLLSEDRDFRHFVTVRTLLLVSALSAPFVVILATREGGVGLGSLGPFIVAEGVAALMGGRAFGRLADRSSQRLMTWGAGASSLVIIVFLTLNAIPDVREAGWFYPVVYLTLALTHVAVRVARKTYVVDLAGGNRRTDYVAVSNTAMGVLLLITGAVSSALAQLGPEAALLFLAALGLVGVFAARKLPDVHRADAR